MSDKGNQTLNQEFPPAGTGEALTEAERDLLEVSTALYGWGTQAEAFAATVGAVERILADRRATEGDLRARIEALAYRYEHMDAPLGTVFRKPLVDHLRAALAQPTTAGSGPT